VDVEQVRGLPPTHSLSHPAPPAPMGRLGDKILGAVVCEHYLSPPEALCASVGILAGSTCCSWVELAPPPWGAVWFGLAAPGEGGEETVLQVLSVCRRGLPGPLVKALTPQGPHIFQARRLGVPFRFPSLVAPPDLVLTPAGLACMPSHAPSLALEGTQGSARAMEPGKQGKRGVLVGRPVCVSEFWRHLPCVPSTPQTLCFWGVVRLWVGL
jgi:hypothetical protein